MKFGVREIVDVVFKATENGQRIGEKTFKKYQPVFMIDTATTSSLEQATTTVYAQGGKGYARLISWEGEKTMTFTVTDALMSPMGLAVLTGAGLISPNKKNQAHVHTTINGYVNANGEVTITLDDLNKEMGLDAKSFDVCNTIEMFATELDGSGAGINYFSNVDIKDKVGDYTTLTETAPITFVVKDDNNEVAKNITVQLDFYTIMNNTVTEVHIEPSSFGGYFYIEAQTLFRREDSGKDMAAEIIIPKAKVQSAFTFTMAASGDPSTFDFVMDAMPGYTRFDSTQKKMCVIQIIGADKTGASDTSAHSHEDNDDYDSPAYVDEFHTAAAKVNADNVTDPDAKDNQNMITSVKKTTVDNKDTIVVKLSGSADDLKDYTPDPTWGPGKRIAVAYDTGEESIVGLIYNAPQADVVDYVLKETDVAEAAAAGFGAGNMIIWIKGDVAKTIPTEFTIETADKTKKVEATIKVEDEA